MNADNESLERRALGVVLIGAAAILLLNLGGREFGVADVLRYAQMVMEMRHHDSMIPTMDGVPYHEAAPLAAWLPYYSTSLFGGLSSASILLHSALAAFLMVALTFPLGRVLNYRTGTIAAAFAAFCYLTWIYGRQSRVDTVTGLAQTGAVLAAYFASTVPDRKRLLWWVVAGAFLGLGVASKGFFAPGIFAFAIGPWMLYQRRWRAILEGGVITILVAAAITAAWYLPYTRVLGPDGTRAFLDVFLGEETVSKFGGDFGKTHGPFWYLLRGTPLLAPMSLLAGVGMYRAIRHRGSTPSILLLCTSWVIGPMILLSLAGGKHLRYLIPMVPAMSVLAAHVLSGWLADPGERAVRVLKRGALVGGAILAAAGVAGIVVAVGWLGSVGYAVILGAVAVSGGVYAIRKATRPAPALLGIYLGLAALTTYNFAVFLPSPMAEETEIYLHLSHQISPSLEEGEVLVVTDMELGEPGAISPSQLSLYLLPRWVELHAENDLPDSAVVLAREPKPGREVRLKFEWKREGGWTDTWYLLDPLK